MKATSTTTVSTKGQIVLPAAIRRQDRIRHGQLFDIDREGPGIYRLVRRETRGSAGLVDWLTSCPEKDWFVPVDGERTDEFPALFAEQTKD